MYKLITISNNKRLAIIDEDMYTYLNRYHWRAGMYMGSWHVSTKTKMNGKNKILLMSRMIVRRIPKGYWVENIDNDAFNLRRSNLLIVPPNYKKIMDSYNNSYKERI